MHNDRSKGFTEKSVHGNSRLKVVGKAKDRIYEKREQKPS